MSNLVTSISLAMNHFVVYAALFTVPFLLLQVVRKKLNFVRLGANYAFLLYVLCVIGLVFFPLPSMDGAVAGTAHGVQIIPFRFVCDIIRETPFVWNQPTTYLPALVDWAVLQVVFNVLMLVPFGMYLRFNFHLTGKKVVMSTFLFSCFIEIGQLTGLFFLFPQAYRLGDVDDLIANTLGGLIGYGIMRFLEKRVTVVGKVENFDIEMEVRDKALL
ncbi:MAG: VanZ family protein [Lachnospiraceae bacterium]|nr:VanZ family protein [Lachnospiraceae bacterium]